MAPGALITSAGIPPGCVQIPIYNHFDRLFPEPDHIVGFFLIDAQFEQDILAEPIYHFWRYEQCGNWNLAAWYERSRDGTPGRTHYMQDSIWRLAGREFTRGYHVGYRNHDDYDLRLENLNIYLDDRFARPAYVRDDNKYVPKPLPQGMRLIDHSDDRVPRRCR